MRCSPHERAKSTSCFRSRNSPTPTLDSVLQGMGRWIQQLATIGEQIIPSAALLRVMLIKRNDWTLNFKA